MFSNVIQDLLREIFGADAVANGMGGHFGNAEIFNCLAMASMAAIRFRPESWAARSMAAICSWVGYP